MYDEIGEFYDEESEIKVRVVRRRWRSDLEKIREELREIRQAEARKLYRLAWKMSAHGCKEENIRKCREEARELDHGFAHDEWIVSDDARRWEYAFRY